jgi:cupin fold WbuC family metalloprotein
MKVFGAEFLKLLVAEARSSSRLRQHHNVHESYDDPSQCLLNAIEPHSYIRPHRHASDPKEERLFALRGIMALVLFNGDGEVTGIVKFGTEKYGNDLALGASVSPHQWHTVISLEEKSVLCEVKAGPFDPSQPKDLASWAPAEGTYMANDYLNRLHELVLNNK